MQCGIILTVFLCVLMAVKAQNAGTPAPYSVFPGQFEPWSVSKGEVPAGTQVTGEMLCSPGPDRIPQTIPWLWWTRGCPYEVPSFSMSHFFLQF